MKIFSRFILCVCISFLSINAHAKVKVEKLDVSTLGAINNSIAWFEGKTFSKLKCTATFKSKNLFVFYTEADDGYTATLRTQNWDTEEVQDFTDFLTVGNDKTFDVCGTVPRNSGQGWIWYLFKG